MRMHCVRTQMVVDAGEVKEIRKKEEKTYWVWTAGAIVCGCVVCAWAVDADEGWWWTWADEGKEIRNKNE